MALACFKSDTDEIVGMNANYVKCKADNFMEQLQHHVTQSKIFIKNESFLKN